MAQNPKPIIGITMGDPAGIGPEIIAKAFDTEGMTDSAEFVLLGDKAVYDFYDPQSAFPGKFHDHAIIKGFTGPHDLSVEERGRASHTYLQTAINLIRENKIHGIVTAPVNKMAIVEAGICDFRGHTEMLANAFNVKRVEMMFVGGPYKTIIATRHIPLSEVARALTPESLYETITLSQRCLQDTFQIQHPRIALCGINPHAGEGGQIGKEEGVIIMPAIQRARDEGIDVSGPYAADTLFVSFNAEKYDLIIAMYHDQGLAPIKAQYFTRLVNFSIGLPFIRTSTAHGTAEDITGQNKADPSSMIEAIRLARDLTAKQKNLL